MKSKAIDVICQHSKDGTIIPLRIRFVDDNGEAQEVNLSSYKDMSHMGTRTMPDGRFVTDKDIIYECKFVLYNREHKINLYYNYHTMIWEMSPTA